ncbi:cation:proton antiporter [Vineibacter terrae]|uniref:cation:proton antiporter n=1 Tax=Vineibacter terrae TaxID=2586908 RepID=UPI002E35D4F5|nr:cation:proton antiporter [Vineibacter terrae]HEX2891102.1 cation:proton antiporter [Vineibacter terrae]
MEFDAAALDLPPMARFGAVLFALLFTPYVTRRLRVPTVVGYIAVGMIIGPHCLAILPSRADTAEFFAELGKLLLMFFVGLEVDLRQFRLNRGKSIAFGLATFALPMAAGTVVAVWFGYSPVAAILIGSLLASHTLIAYPIIIDAGLSKLPAITITVGATILTDIMSLLTLAICLTIHQTGFAPRAIALQLGQLAAFIVVMLAVVGPVGRWAFHRLGRTEEASFILMLIVVAGGATIAEVLHLEGILGAFLAGLAVNTVVRGTAAKEKIEFLGNSVFVPAFFIVTGFLIDLRVFVATLWSNPGMVIAIIGGLIGAKWLAAELAGRVWRLSATDRGLMASLTMPQVAATLAAAMVGYEAVNAAGVRLIDGTMLNTILVLVVVTAMVGPVLTEHYVRKRGAAVPDASPPPSALAPAGGNGVKTAGAE